MYIYNKNMKKIITLIFANLFFGLLFTQTYPDTIGYDQMESYNWSGNWWSNGNNIGFASNISVSEPASAYFYGTGNANSKVEDNWYVLPNIDTLKADEEYKMKFHFASPRITSVGTTSGIDLDDYIDIQVSTDGGITYNSEVRITGFNNAYWDYNSATISKVVNGTLETYGPAGGGDRTLIGDGISIVELTFPLGVTQIAIDIYVRANSAGEEFWMDDFFMLGSGSGGFALPVDLINFGVGTNDLNNVVIEWSTLSQVNNDYFTIQRSLDAFEWFDVIEIPGAGNTNSQMDYHYEDKNPYLGLSYYRLVQTDYDGKFEVFSPKSVRVKNQKTIGLKIIPNPSIDYIEIDLVHTSEDVKLYNHDIQIYDIEGNKIYKKHFIGDISDFKINIENFKSGIYVVKSNSDNFKGEAKFIKETE